MPSDTSSVGALRYQNCIVIVMVTSTHLPHSVTQMVCMVFLSSSVAFQLMLVCGQDLANKKLVERRHQVEKVDKLRLLANEIGCTLPQLAIAWCAANPHVSSVIMGASKVSQVCADLLI